MFHLAFNYPTDCNSSFGAVTLHRVNLAATNAQHRVLKLKIIMKLLLKKIVGHVQ